MIATVFGGSGFLGSAVADELTAQGYRVRIYDREPSKWLSGNQEMIIGTLNDTHSVCSAVENAAVVYNFAALADLNIALTKPLETIEINVLGNAHVMEACVSEKVERFVFASSVYVHGKHGGFYKSSKRAAEEYVKEYNRSRGLEYTILRFGSLYGPRSDRSNGLFRVVDDALRNGVISYSGNRDAQREYIHVLDAARLSARILSDDFANKSVILTGHQTVSVVDVMILIAEILGLPKDFDFNNEHARGHYDRTPFSFEEYTLLENLALKWSPELHVELAQGLTELIRYVATINGNLKY